MTVFVFAFAPVVYAHILRGELSAEVAAAQAPFLSVALFFLEMAANPRKAFGKELFGENLCSFGGFKIICILLLEACVIQQGTQSPLAVAGKVLDTSPKTVSVNCLLAIGTAAPTSVAHAVQVLHMDGRVEAGMWYLLYRVYAQLPHQLDLCMVYKVVKYFTVLIFEPYTEFDHTGALQLAAVLSISVVIIDSAPTILFLHGENGYTGYVLQSSSRNVIIRYAPALGNICSTPSSDAYLLMSKRRRPTRNRHRRGPGYVRCCRLPLFRMAWYLRILCLRNVGGNADVRRVSWQIFSTLSKPHIATVRG